MAGVVQFSEAAQTGGAEIQAADVVIACMEADAEHVRANFPFDEYGPMEVVIARSHLLRRVRQDAQIFFIANGSGEQGATSFATWLGRPVFWQNGSVQGMNSEQLVEALEGAKRVLPTSPEKSEQNSTNNREFHDEDMPPADLRKGADQSAFRSVDKSPLPSLVDVAAVLQHPIDFPPTLIEGLLHQGSKLVLGGGSKSFKTWSLIDLAVSVAAGTAWWGFPATKGKVCYINFEIQDAFFFDRIRRVAEARGVEIELGAISVWNLRGYAANAGDIIPQLVVELAKKGFGLIIIDPIYKMNVGADENAAGDSTKLMNLIERLAVETAAAVAIGMHFSKGNQAEKSPLDRISGSGVFARDPDTILTLTEHETPDCFTVESVVRNFAPVPAFVVRREHPLMIRDDALDPAALKQAKSRAGKGVSKTALDLLALVPPLELIGKNALLNKANQAREEGGLGIGQTKAQGFLKELIEQGRLFEFEGPKRSRTNRGKFISRHAPALI